MRVEAHLYEHYPWWKFDFGWYLVFSLRLERYPHRLYGVKGGGFHRGFTKEFHSNVVVGRTKLEMILRCLVGGSGIPLDSSYDSDRMLDLETETEDHILSRKWLWDGWNGHTKFGGVRLSFTISTNTSFAKYEDWAPNKSSVLLQ